MSPGPEAFPEGTLEIAWVRTGREKPLARLSLAPISRDAIKRRRVRNEKVSLHGVKPRSFSWERLKQQEADVEHCGIDLALDASSICVMGARGFVQEERVLATEEAAWAEFFGGRRAMRCVLEASPLSEWAALLLEQLGHEAIVIDPRKAKGVIATKKETDRLDARNLAKMSLTGWYTAVHRKSPQARAMRTYLQARQGLVQTRLSQGSRIRGLLRAHGIKVGPIARSGYAMRVRQLAEQKAPHLWPMLEPLVELWQQAIYSAEEMKRQLARQMRQDAVAVQLMKVPGIGPLTAAAYMATIDQPERFVSGDQVAAYVGLVPSVQQSGQLDRHGHITREGDGLLRSYLVEAAHVLLTRKKGSCALRIWGLKLAKKKGPNKAKVAVARKLAVLLHHLWITGQSYQTNQA